MLYILIIQIMHSLSKKCIVSIKITEFNNTIYDLFSVRKKIISYLDCAFANLYKLSIVHGKITKINMHNT
jgi:hypothetical protein